MEQDLVGYLLDALDPDSHRQVEKYLNDDPAGRQQLDALRRALEPLACDRDHPEPAPGLAFRTLARVAEYRCRPLPQAPAPPPADGGGTGRRWWRPRADLLVAASLLILLGGIGVPALVHLRREHNRQACANNLRLMHQALEAYRGNHNDEFPYSGGRPPHNVAGMFVPVLRDAGAMPEGVSVRCPENGEPHLPSQTVQELKQMSPEEFQQEARKLASCYAYTLGYRDANGKFYGLRRDPTQLNNGLLPILADRPSVQGTEGEDRGNSDNHHGGQNVLYLEGNVRFCRDPYAGIDGDNIYLNREGKVAAGVNQWDAVLGCSDDRP